LVTGLIVELYYPTVKDIIIYIELERVKNDIEQKQYGFVKYHANTIATRCGSDFEQIKHAMEQIADPASLPPYTIDPSVNSMKSIVASKRINWIHEFYEKVTTDESYIKTLNTYMAEMWVNWRHDMGMSGRTSDVILPLLEDRLSFLKNMIILGLLDNTPFLSIIFNYTVPSPITDLESTLLSIRAHIMRILPHGTSRNLSRNPSRINPTNQNRRSKKRKSRKMFKIIIKYIYILYDHLHLK
jgi:hypothetical protein